MKNVYMLVLTTALVHALTFVSASPLTDGELASDEGMLGDLKDVIDLDYNNDYDDSVDVVQVSQPMESEDPLDQDQADDEVPLSENGRLGRRGWWRRVGHAIVRVFIKIFHHHRRHHHRRALEEDSYQTSELYGSVDEVKPYSTPEKFKELLNSKVARSDLLVRLLDVTNPQYSSAVDGKQYGVIASLVDGRRVFLFKGNKEGQEAKTIMMLANNLSDEWKKIKSKLVESSQLHHFLAEGGQGFSKWGENLQAALRMMRLN